MRTYKLFLFLEFLCPDNLLNKVKVFIFVVYVILLQNGGSLSKFIPINSSVFFHILLYFSKKSASLISEDMVIFYLNVLPLQTYSGSFIYSGLVL